MGLDGAQWPWSSRPAGLRAVLIRSQDWSVIRSYRDHGRAADGPRTVSFPRPIDCTLRGGPGESGPAEAAADSPGGIAGSCGRHAFAPGEHHDHFPKISRSLERLASKPSPEFLRHMTCLVCHSRFKISLYRGHYPGAHECGSRVAAGGDSGDEVVLDRRCCTGRGCESARGGSVTTSAVRSADSRKRLLPRAVRHATPCLVEPEASHVALGSWYMSLPRDPRRWRGLGPATQLGRMTSDGERTFTAP